MRVPVRCTPTLHGTQTYLALTPRVMSPTHRSFFSLLSFVCKCIYLEVGKLLTLIARQQQQQKSPPCQKYVT
jgi:hypothetical protein